MSDNNGLNISRRRALAGIGAIGVASAGAGVGTSAYFSDEESFNGNSLTAGELDLKVDWEEHYNFPQIYGFDDPIDGLDVHRSEPESSDEYVAMPDPSDPMVWVHEDDLVDYMSNTSIEAFPDTDNDGEQEVEGSGFSNGEFFDPCKDGADLPDDLELDSAGIGRTDNGDTNNGDGGNNPLVSLDDVKPGDFGELTLSYHLCDNPGYAWLIGDLVSESGGGHDESDGPQLADRIKAVAWYDDGDNVFDRCADRQEVHYLTDYEIDSETTLYEVTLDQSNTEAVTVRLGTFEDEEVAITEGTHIGTSPDGSKVYGIASENQDGERYLGIYDVDATSMSVETVDTAGYDLGIVSQAAVDTTGKLYVGSRTKDKLFVIEDPGSSPTVNKEIDISDEISIEGSDNVFASNGQLYLHTNDDDTIYAVNLLDGTTSEVAEYQLDGSNNLTGLTLKSGGSSNFVASRTDNDEVVELDTAGNVVETYSYTGDLDNHTYGDMSIGALCEREITSGTLRDVLSELQSDGIKLNDLGTKMCFMPGFTRYIGFAWWLPTDVGNEVQGDSIEFDIGFYTEQCRHNDSPTGPSSPDT